MSLALSLIRKIRAKNIRNIFELDSNMFSYIFGSNFSDQKNENDLQI